jgi:hypothetical protein
MKQAMDASPVVADEHLQIPVLVITRRFESRSASPFWVRGKPAECLFMTRRSPIDE